MLALTTVVVGPTLRSAWSGWAAAAAVWGLNLLLVVYAVGPPYRVSRPTHLVTGFAFFMTLFGSGSYWATTQIYPDYRVSIDRAALLVACCTALTLGAAATIQRLTRDRRKQETYLEWDWARVRAVTILLFGVAFIGTVVSIRRIGYLPILTGDPNSARVDFPMIGGVWYRLSMIGGVVALLVATQVAARRATTFQTMLGAASLVLVGLYGPRFFVALPLGVAVLLWDKLRRRIRLVRAVLLFAIAAPAFAVVGHFRQRDPSLDVLSPLGLALYGALGEFRDLGWTIDYYGFGDRYLNGATLGSVVVPLLPAPVWQVAGIDKAQVYAQSSANLLADAMGQTTGQRVGIYGEFFMNFGWEGAWLGALAFGLLVGFLDSRFSHVGPSHVRALFLGLAIATATFALVGQLDMFTSTLTGTGYPLALVALLSARRRHHSGDVASAAA
jgi:hypothetical protein